MVGKYYTDLSGGFFGNCWSQLKRVTSYPAIYASRLFPRPPSKPGWSAHLNPLAPQYFTNALRSCWSRWSGGRGPGALLASQWLFLSSSTSLSALAWDFARFNLESERIWPDDPWPTSPIKPTLRAAPKTRVVSALWEAGLKSRQFPPGPPAAAGEIRDRRHGFLPTPLLHWGREKAHKFEAGPRSVKGSGNFLCRLCGPVLQWRACAEKMRFSGKVGWGVKTKKHRGGRGEGGPGHIKFMQTKQFPWPNKVKRMLPCSGIKSNLIKVS